jgi:hypothetical protein
VAAVDLDVRDVGGCGSGAIDHAAGLRRIGWLRGDCDAVLGVASDSGGERESTVGIHGEIVLQVVLQDEAAGGAGKIYDGAADGEFGWRSNTVIATCKPEGRDREDSG